MPLGNKKKKLETKPERAIDSLANMLKAYDKIRKKKYTVRLKIHGGLRLEITED